MNGFEDQNGATSGAGIEELRAELRVMRRLVAVSLAMLIGLSICADYFLSRQTQALNAESAQLQTVVDGFPQAAANDFVNRLKEYAKTHADFAPIANKYASVFGQSAPKK